MKKLLLPLLACFALASAAIAGGTAKYADISREELKAAIAAGKVTLIDVNGTDSYKEGHIPGAIDFEASEAKLAAALPADKSSLIVAYCGSPKCTAYKQGAAAAAKLGYTDVKHFSDGISGWKKAGEATEKAK
jgi:rhodanese-related sulfurtransferase